MPPGLFIAAIFEKFLTRIFKVIEPIYLLLLSKTGTNVNFKYDINLTTS